VELLAAVQGIEFHRPLKSSAVLERAVALVRSRVKPYLSDRFMAPDLEAARSLVASGSFAAGRLGSVWMVDQSAVFECDAAIRRLLFPCRTSAPSCRDTPRAIERGRARRG